MANFKDPSFARDQGDVLVGDSFDFSGHTVSFREVVSLSAVFNLDHDGKDDEMFCWFRQSKVVAWEPEIDWVEDRIQSLNR